jgi:hypothetical protein
MIAPRRASEREDAMAVKLHRCPSMWAKLGGHPCWRVQKALDDQGVDYEVVKGPWPGRSKRTALIAGTGQSAYPAIEFEDGTWYREQSKEMERTIREGRLLEKQGSPAAS